MGMVDTYPCLLQNQQVFTLGTTILAGTVGTGVAGGKFTVGFGSELAGGNRGTMGTTAGTTGGTAAMSFVIISTSWGISRYVARFFRVSRFRSMFLGYGSSRKSSLSPPPFFIQLAMNVIGSVPNGIKRLGVLLASSSRLHFIEKCLIKAVWMAKRNFCFFSVWTLFTSTVYGSHGTQISTEAPFFRLQDVSDELYWCGDKSLDFSVLCNVGLCFWMSPMVEPLDNPFLELDIDCDKIT